MTTFPLSPLTTALSSILAPTKKPMLGQHAYALIRFTGSGSAELEAYNGVLRCTTTADGATGEPLEILVDAEMLKGALEGATAETVEIEVTDNRIKLLAGKRKAQVPTLPYTDQNWTPSVNVDGKPLGRIKVENAKALVTPLKIAAALAKACPDDRFKTVEIIPIDGKLWIFGTDRHRIFLANLDATIKGDSFAKLPVDACDEIIKNVDGTGLFRLFENALIYSCGTFTLETAIGTDAKPFTKFAQEQFAKLQGADSAVAVANRLALISAIKSAEGVSVKRAIPSVKFDIGIGELTVSSDNSESSVESQVAASTIGMGQFRAHGGELANYLTKLDCESVNVEYKTGNPTAFFNPHVLVGEGENVKNSECVVFGTQIIRNE